MILPQTWKFHTIHLLENEDVTGKLVTDLERAQKDLEQALNTVSPEIGHWGRLLHQQLPVIFHAGSISIRIMNCARPKKPIFL